MSGAAAQSRVLEVAALSARYGHVEALQPVDLFVGGGELVAVLGPNGAGKSTLMRAVMGLVATQGAVRFCGNAVPRNPVGAAAMGLVLVPEGRGIFGPMSVAENLELGAYLLNDKAELARRHERVLGLFPRLKERLGQTAGSLSGGEQQMLAVARALMSRPRVLLMDEPSLGLAPLVVAEIFRIVAELNRDGTTIFLVEQNAHMALQVAHHFYLMEQGRVTFSGTPGQLAEDEVIQRAYLGARRAG